MRQGTGSICRHPDHLAERDALALKAIRQRCPELHAAVELVRGFADLLMR